MPVKTTCEVVGVKQAINNLGKIDKQLQKDFKADATAIAQPAINAAKKRLQKRAVVRYAIRVDTTQPQTIPFTVAKAVSGVRMRFDTRRNAVGVILIEQKDPAAAIFETAGRANSNKLGNALGFVGAGRTRLIGPAVYKARRGIEAEMTKMIVKTIATVQREI
jgi:ribosomal protein S5